MTRRTWLHTMAAAQKYSPAHIAATPVRRSQAHTGSMASQHNTPTVTSKATCTVVQARWPVKDQMPRSSARVDAKTITLPVARKTAWASCMPMTISTSPSALPPE